MPGILFFPSRSGTGPEPDKKYVYRDVKSWENPEQWELIDGVPIKLPPPSKRHEAAVEVLFQDLLRKIDPMEFVVTRAPQVYIMGEVDCAATVVRPDIMVWSRTDALAKHGCPIIIAEIAMPETLAHDEYTKKRLYERQHIREYWIIPCGE